MCFFNLKQLCDNFSNIYKYQSIFPDTNCSFAHFGFFQAWQNKIMIARYSLRIISTQMNSVAHKMCLNNTNKEEEHFCCIHLALVLKDARKVKRIKIDNRCQSEMEPDVFSTNFEIIYPQTCYVSTLRV